MRQVTRVLAAIALGAAMSVRAGPCAAQQIQLTGPLGDYHVPAILAGKRPYRERRFHVAADLALTLGNELQRAVLPGVRITYHFNDRLGAGLWAAYALHATTAFTDGLQASIDQRACDHAPTTTVCTATARSVTRPGTNGDGTLRTGRLVDDQLGRFTWLVAPQLTFTPLRGKLAALNPRRPLGLGVDATVSMGIAVVGLRERTPCSAALCADQFSLETRVRAAPLLGIGLTLYPALFLSFGVEGRILPFAWNPSGFDVRGHQSESPDGAVDDADRVLRVNGMAAAFVAVHFPLTDGPT